MTLREWPQSFVVLTSVLWVGGTWVIGYLVAPVLFQALSDRQLAGLLAGKMFSLMAFVGLGCALYLLAYQLFLFGKRAVQKVVFRIVFAMLLLLLLGEFVLQPMMAELKFQALPLIVMQSTFATEFKLLHGAASLLYLLQSLLGVVLVLDLKRGWNAE